MKFQVGDRVIWTEAHKEEHLSSLPKMYGQIGTVHHIERIFIQVRWDSKTVPLASGHGQTRWHYSRFETYLEPILDPDNRFTLMMED